jgi:hypothetical protein
VGGRAAALPLLFEIDFALVFDFDFKRGVPHVRPAQRANVGHLRTRPEDFFAASLHSEVDFEFVFDS